MNVASANVTTHQTTTGFNSAELRELFKRLYAHIETSPATPTADKEDLKADVKEIQSTVAEAVQKNEKVDEGFL